MRDIVGELVEFYRTQLAKLNQNLGTWEAIHADHIKNDRAALAADALRECEKIRRKIADFERERDINPEVQARSAV